MAAGRELLEACVAAGGALSGEHGIGLEKNNFMPWVFSEDDLDMMERARDAFDPARTFSIPGKILPSHANVPTFHSRTRSAALERPRPVGVTAPSERGTAPEPADYFSCVHCGLCLEHCPTYLQTGLEISSPRARIHLITALNEGRIEPSEVYAESIEQCLVCRACEAACPSGVPFGRIMESARAQLRERDAPRRVPGSSSGSCSTSSSAIPSDCLRLGETTSRISTE